MIAPTFSQYLLSNINTKSENHSFSLVHHDVTRLASMVIFVKMVLGLLTVFSSY